MIEVKNLVKDYGKHHAVKDISFSVPDGQIVGLLGPNGSGKTTTINCILALLAFDKGTVRVFGREMRPDSYDLKRQIGVVMQNVAVFQELTVYENIDYFCGLYVPDKRKRKELVEEAITFTDLNDYRKMRPKKLSGGLLRRLNIACGIAHKPKLIFFDEPTVAVDPQSRNRILEGIKRLNEEGATIVYTSHYMEEVEQLCDRIVIMDKGKSVAVGTKEELKKMIKNTETIKVEVLGLTGKQISELRRQPHMYEEEYSDGMLTLRYSGGRHNLVRLMEFFKEHDISFGRVVTELPTLNDVFLEITGKELRD